MSNIIVNHIVCELNLNKNNALEINFNMENTQILLNKKRKFQNLYNAYVKCMCVFVYVKKKNARVHRLQCILSFLNVYIEFMLNLKILCIPLFSIAKSIKIKAQVLFKKLF